MSPNQIVQNNVARMAQALAGKIAKRMMAGHAMLAALNRSVNGVQ
jgi:hypothetical protein